MTIPDIDFDLIDNEPVDECQCKNCINTDLYSRLYCRDCYDMACSKTDEDQH